MPNTDLTPPTRRPVSPRWILAAVGFSVFVAADDLTVVSTMLRPIIGDLGLRLPDGLDDAAWIVNAYLIAFVAVMPLAGRISDVIGRRRTFAGAYVLFLAGSILIPLSIYTGEPLRWFLVGRVLTALGGGAMVPVALAVVGDEYPEHARARALGTLGAIETLGWVWGPLYGAALVELLSWQWQFWLNVPLSVVGFAAVWRALAGHDRPSTRPRIDWLGAALVTIALVSLNVGLLAGAEIQSVTGLDELTGGGGSSAVGWFVVAAFAAAGFVWRSRTTADPLFSPRLWRGRNVLVALVVNFAVGAALVITMVDVPLFVNAVEIDVERSAVVAGAILSALTVAMAITSYVGGRHMERSWYRPPLLAGVAMATAALAWMGATWDADAPYALFVAQLALLGAGIGLTVAPINGAVVDAAPPDQRGAAAGLVMVVRLLGLSVGLSALTAWGLARFKTLRGEIELPPIGSPGFDAAVLDAQERLTAQAIAETFTAVAVVMGVALAVTALMRRNQGATMDDADTSPGAIDAAPDAIDAATIGAAAATAGAATGLADPVALDPAPADPAELAPSGELAALARRMQLMVGIVAVVIAGALVLIALLVGRVNQARADAAAAKAELADTAETLARVEAGAALYASQITGFQETLSALQPQIAAGVDEAIAGLREFGDSTISFTVNIDEELPVDTEIVIDRVVKVPIKTTLPIDQSFDTTIRVETPLGFTVPLDVTVPVNVEVPIDLVVDIPIKETVPISDRFPVKLDVPIAIDVSETELKTLIDSLAAGLESLQAMLDGLS